jgi:hypothetical protein
VVASHLPLLGPDEPADPTLDPSSGMVEPCPPPRPDDPVAPTMDSEFGDDLRGGRRSGLTPSLIAAFAAVVSPALVPAIPSAVP